ncbi:nitrogen regulatory protein P-II homolog [Cucumis sativus]|uniref:Nitrogen regulatory protein P-II homolog n=1 Tax=Cucumis sativus TaxID=3659 RepID=A0A0A0K850_CUCSA|nr:nitrogen regulatory protein P-II homolog [Cucumis sativus]KGN45044.1 hypothetical protein Csa_015915 [Cucumis sativus]
MAVAATTTNLTALLLPRPQFHHFTSFSFITPYFTTVGLSHFNLANNHPSNRQILPLVKATQGSLDYVPDSKFYKVEAILRPWRIQNVSSALLKMGIRGVTVSDVKGFGSQGGSKERHGGSEFSEDNFVTKVKMEIVVVKDQVEAVIDKIIEEARTGEIGDGKIFVIPISDVIRIRTGERGERAERMTGGRSDMSDNNRATQ